MLFDTNVIIDYLNNKLPDNSNFILDEISNPIISIVTRIELSILPNATIEQENNTNDKDFLNIKNLKIFNSYSL